MHNHYGEQMKAEELFGGVECVKVTVNVDVNDGEVNVFWMFMRKRITIGMEKSFAIIIIGVRCVYAKMFGSYA